jgi:hypothetical protein
VLRAALVVSLVAAAAGVSPVRMTATPAYILRVCRSSVLLHAACPRRLPYVARLRSQQAFDVVSLCVAGRPGCLGIHWDDLEIEASGIGDRPPRFTHVSILAGSLAKAFPFAYPVGGKRARLENGLFARDRPRPIFFGAVVWGGRRGTLVLAPAYPVGGEEGDHLIFRWRRGATGYAIGLHAWEPLTRAEATLRAIVESG